MTKPSTTPNQDHKEQRFRITHPHHPRFGQEFELVVHRYNWGENRAFYYDEQGRLVSIPADWTSVVAPDPFVAIAQGRSYFRVEDLLRLAELIEPLRAAAPDDPSP